MHTVCTVCFLVKIHTCKVLWEKHRETKRKGVNLYLKVQRQEHVETRQS